MCVCLHSSASSLCRVPGLQSRHAVGDPQEHAMRDCAPQKTMDARSFPAGRGAALSIAYLPLSAMSHVPPALSFPDPNRRLCLSHQAEHSAVAPYMMLDHTHGESRVAELWASGACPRPAFEKRSGRRYSSVNVSRNGAKSVQSLFLSHRNAI